MTALIIYLLATLMISFTCSILESVLLSTPLSYITMRESQGYKPARLFKRYKTETDKPIAAILSLNTIANTIGAAAIGGQSVLVFGSEMFGVISIVTTFLILIISEIIPKNIGTHHWKHLMGVAAYVIRFIIYIMYPLVLMVGFIGKWLRPAEDSSIVSRDEVSAMADIGEKEGVIDAGENKVIQNIMKLDNVKASEAMTPRIVAATAQENMTLRNFYKDDNYLHYSRIPVYSDSPEFITGYILLSDALEGLADDKFDMRLREIKRPISFFEEDKPLSEVWEGLLRRKEQMGVVIDEYGCFQGILTLEDIIETILGLEIIDENDAAIDMQQYAKDRWERRQRRYKTNIVIPSDAPDAPSSAAKQE